MLNRRPKTVDHAIEGKDGFTARGRRPRRITTPMPEPLPHETIPTMAQLRQTVEYEIDRLLPAVDDNHRHVLDTWLATQEADARAALDELIARQQRVADALVTRAQSRRDRAALRHTRRQRRVDLLAERAAQLRHDLVPTPPRAPEPQSVHSRNGTVLPPRTSTDHDAIPIGKPVSNRDR